MPGFTAGVVTFWYKEGARIHHQLVELDPSDVLTACAKYISGWAEPYVEGDKFYFQDKAIAQRVQLYPSPDRNGVRYYSAPAPLTGSDPTDHKIGWTILSDVEVITPKGQRWMVMQQGETYCADAGCSLVVYDYEPTHGWRRWLAPVVSAISRLFVPLLWLLAKVVGWCIRYLDDKVIRDWERAQFVEVQEMLNRLGRELYADEEEMNAMLRGEVEAINIPDCVVVRVDFEGHTARRKTMGKDALREVLRSFWNALFDFDVNPEVRRGRLPRKLHPGNVVVRFGNHTGDGGYIFIYNAPINQLSQIAVILAAELHEAAERAWDDTGMKPLPLRVTVDSGAVDLVSYGRRRNADDPNDDRRVLVRFFAEGDPLDNCARLDAVAKQFRTRARFTGQDARWMTLMPMQLFRWAEHAEIDGYEDLGVVDVRDMGPTHLIRVVHQADQRVDWNRIPVAGKEVKK